MSTALTAALDGKPVSTTAAPKALAEAAEKLNALKARLGVVKENAGSAASAGISALETVGTLALAGAAEGYWGEEKMKLGPVPIRASAGLGLLVWGLGSTLMGGNGAHQLAFGEALVGADAYMLGRQGGVALREKKAKGETPAPGQVQGTPAQQKLLADNAGSRMLNGKVVAANGAALEGDDLGELARMIRLQNGTEGERPDGARPARRALPAGAPRRRENLTA